jgi:hypothetical protein
MDHPQHLGPDVFLHQPSCIDDPLGGIVGSVLLFVVVFAAYNFIKTGFGICLRAVFIMWHLL